MSTLCPVCGSDELKKTTHKHTLTVIYGNPSEYNEVIEKCLTCEESGDFSEVNDETITQLTNIAKKQSITNMVEYLSSHNIKMSYMERSLELPARTVARWKNGDYSAASLALLRIIRTYPWILEVADDHFNESIAHSRLVEEAVHVIKHTLTSHTQQTQMHILLSEGSIDVHAKFQINNTYFSPESLTPKLENMLVIESNI
ncbi:MAG: hypothetical protein KAJ63_09055 [Methyloprofundus sp.]|nr:hypothetical protein [Methyloprofundus sp.]